MRFVIRLKAWTIFTVIFFLPMIGSVISGMISKEVNIGAISRIIGIVLYFSWLGMLGLYLNSKNQFTRKNLHYLFLATLIICTFTYISMNVQTLQKEHSFKLFILQGILMPFTLFSFFFNSYFVAKNFRSLELKREAKMSDCIFETLMMIVWPIGVWFIQPRIQRSFSDE